MSNLNQAVERIKRLECPAEEVESRIEAILLEYGVPAVSPVKNEAVFEADGAHLYSAEIKGRNYHSLFVLAKTGEEDYVAKVVDVYFH